MPAQDRVISVPLLHRLPLAVCLKTGQLGFSWVAAKSASLATLWVLPWRVSTRGTRAFMLPRQGASEKKSMVAESTSQHTASAQ